MRNVYIILTYTGTILSRVIRLYTHNEYAHVSIALDEDLKQMYSFGRINPYIAFIGGFVHESPKWGTFKRFKDTKALIYKLEVTDEQYNIISGKIQKMGEEKSIYSFNVIGLFAAGFHKKVSKQNAFYCAEFIKYLLDNAKIENNLPYPVKPQDFNNYLKEEIKAELIYNGKLREYLSKPAILN